MLHVVPGERLYPLAVAVSKATGHRPNPATCYRWLDRPVPLPSVKLGGKRLTSVEAVARWVEVCSRADSCVTSRTGRRRAADLEQAQQELRDAGI